MINFNNRIKIDEKATKFGVFEMWCHISKDVPDIITLDGKYLTRTRNTLDQEVDEYIYIYVNGGKQWKL